MKQVMLGARASVVAMVGLLVAQGAAAQSMGSVSYAPLAASNVPTVSEWGLIGMAVLVALAAYHAMRAQGSRALKAWTTGLLVCGVLSASLWNHPAIATPPPVEIALDQSTGGVADIPHNAELFFPPFTHVYTVQNQTAVAQRVTGVSTRPDLLLETPTGFTPECTVGLVLQPDDMCYLKANGMNMPG